uniref:Uncharacterized protein n=1 Tax=Leersia perrieri TaxID=77586 RepID=A0A0D9WF39_9ORYZ
MEKGSSSSASANANNLTLGQAMDMPVKTIQLFGTHLHIPATSTATATAPAAANTGSATALSLNAFAGLTQGQGNLSLSLQPAGVLAPTMAPPTMLEPLAMGPAAPVAQNTALATVANAPAWQRNNLAAERATVLVRHLRRCAEALVMARSVDVDAELTSIMRLASPDGDAVQRMAAAFAAALARVAISPWRGVSAALFATDGRDDGTAVALEAAVARQNFLKVCPLLRLAAVAANELIIEATKDDKLIHIVDLGGVNPGQWVELMVAFTSRYQGRPSVRLTVVIKEPGQSYSQAATILTGEATRLGLPFELHVVDSSLDELKLDTLGVRSDHALIVISTLQLHRLGTGTSYMAVAPGIASSLPVAMSSSTVDNLLSGLHRLSPSLFIVTENEANHFWPRFRERFTSALGYYEQLFRSMEEASVLCQPAERKAVERHILKEEIKDIIACENGPRWTRHEQSGMWIGRIDAAGFELWPMGIILAAGRIRSVASQQYGGSHRYGVTEGNGWLILNRMNKPIFCVSAWRSK